MIKPRESHFRPTLTNLVRQQIMRSQRQRRDTCVTMSSRKTSGNFTMSLLRSLGIGYFFLNAVRITSGVV